MELSDQFLTAFLTTCLTLLGGCGILLITELLVKPYVEYRRIIGQIAFKLVLNANIIASAPPQMERDIAIAEELRKLAARLRASIASFPEPVRQGRRFLPVNDILEASRCLIGLSNAMLNENKDYDFIAKNLEGVERLLKIPI
jgi:hypothetical protein